MRPTIQALGRLADHYKLFLVLADNQPTSVAALRDIVLRAGAARRGAARRRRARSASSHAPQWIRVNADGQDAVLLQVYQQPGGNSVQIAERRQGSGWPTTRRRCPPGVQHRQLVRPEPAGDRRRPAACAMRS